MSTSSAKFRITTNENNGQSVASASIAVLSSATFQVYCNNIEISSGTVDNFFPNAGYNSIVTTEITVSYSRIEAVLWSYVLHGGSIITTLSGTANVETPLGVIDFPFRLTDSGGSSGSIGLSSAKFKINGSTENDLALAYLTNATFRVYANNIELLNGAANSLPPNSSSIPSISEVKSEITVPYSGVGAVIWSDILHGGMMHLNVSGVVRLMTTGQFSGNELNLPLNFSSAPGDLGSYPLFMYSVLFILAALIFFLHRKGFARFS